MDNQSMTNQEKIENMPFERALVCLKRGVRVARAGWNAHHELGLQFPDAGSANSLPYIYMVVGTDAADLKGARVPWVASHTDLMAGDWFIAE